MNIRRERLHQCGLTNLDFRTKGDVENIDRYHPTLKYADFGTMGKTQFKRLHSVADQKESMKLTSGFMTAPNITTTPAATFNPAKYDTTKDFYASKGKKYKLPAQIGKKRETELEDLKWTDRVFTGDNPAATAYRNSQVNLRNQSYNVDSKKRQTFDGQRPSSSKAPTDSMGIKNKKDVNAEAEGAETQLV